MNDTGNASRMLASGPYSRIEVDISTKWRNCAELDSKSNRKTPWPHFTNIEMRAVVNENITLGANNEQIGGKWEIGTKIQ